MTTRRGATLVETLVALTLLLLIVQLTWATAAGLRRAAAALEAGAEGLAAERAVWWILREELSASRSGIDFLVAGGDSVAMRAFRGLARACPEAGGPDGSVAVRYGGTRRPEPDKDSVLILGGDGHWRAADLVAVEGGVACGGDAGGGERWRVGGDARGALLLRVFERGSYHLADGALRYRRGAAGRQPLTPTMLDPVASGIFPLGGGASVTATWSPPGPHPRVRGWTRTLRPWGVR